MNLIPLCALLSHVQLPLESNPDVINRYLEKLGFPVTLLAATDVMSTEEWALEMVPRPVAAVLMVYPIKEVQEGEN